MSEFAIVNETPEYIFIVDTVRDKRCVTHDAKAIVLYLSEHHDLKNRRLFYRDTLGNIDEILHEAHSFKGFAPGHQGITLPDINI